MRIDLNHRLAEIGESAEQANPRAAAGASGKTALADDRAELSADQARVQSLAREVNRLPDVRQQKVEALSLAVRQGSYEVSPEQTADAMLLEMQERPAA